VEDAARDPFTARHWNQRDIILVVAPPVHASSTVAGVTSRLLGRTLDAAGWARLLGVPDAAHITLAVEAHQSHIGVEATILHRWYTTTSTRFLYRDGQGDLVVENVYLDIRDDAPPYLATRLLAHQVRETARLGVKYLTTAAAGRPGAYYGGYYAWARLGFDGRIPTAVGQLLERQPHVPQLHGARGVLDLVTRPGGAEWWRANGSEFAGLFDLALGSRSSLVLEAYTRQKGIRI